MNTNKILAESIAKEYAQKQDSKLIALKKLDKKAKKPAKSFAWIFGIISSLIAGTGMCLAIQVIGQSTEHMLIGIVIGIIGFALCGINYPTYKKLLEKCMKKYSFEIVEIAREICDK